MVTNRSWRGVWPLGLGGSFHHGPQLGEDDFSTLPPVAVSADVEDAVDREQVGQLVEPATVPGPGVGGEQVADLLSGDHLGYFHGPESMEAS